MIELSKDKKSGTWLITKTDKEGYHKQLNVTVREMVDLFEMFRSNMKETENKKEIDFITEERLKELLSILLPYGYSHYDGCYYTGVSPYIGDRRNVITIVANEPAWGSMPLSIIMETFDEESNEDDSLGFYKGIMKVIAPELHSDDDKFKDNMNVLDFKWAEDKVQDNRFPVEVKYRPINND